MVQVEEQLLPTAFARAANVDSTFAYMGSLMTFLATGSETGGRFALMEYHTKPGMSLRLTSMSGNMSRTTCWKAHALLLRGQDSSIGAGDVVFLPKVRPMHSPALLMSYAR
jgi:hypothetical protein